MPPKAQTGKPKKSSWLSHNRPPAQSVVTTSSSQPSLSPSSLSSSFSSLSSSFSFIRQGGGSSQSFLSSGQGGNGYSTFSQSSSLFPFPSSSSFLSHTSRPSFIKQWGSSQSFLSSGQGGNGYSTLSQSSSLSSLSSPSPSSSSSNEKKGENLGKRKRYEEKEDSEGEEISDSFSSSSPRIFGLRSGPRKAAPLSNKRQRANPSPMKSWYTDNNLTRMDFLVEAAKQDEEGVGPFFKGMLEIKMPKPSPIRKISERRIARHKLSFKAGTSSESAVEHENTFRRISKTESRSYHILHIQGWSQLGPSADDFLNLASGSKGANGEMISLDHEYPEGFINLNAAIVQKGTSRAHFMIQALAHKDAPDIPLFTKAINAHRPSLTLDEWDAIETGAKRMIKKEELDTVHAFHLFKSKHNLANLPRFKEVIQDLIKELAPEAELEISSKDAQMYGSTVSLSSFSFMSTSPSSSSNSDQRSS